MSLITAASQVRGVSNTLTGAVDTLTRLGVGPYGQQLQPASFRNLPFGVVVSRGSYGRRNALHEYPNRETCWVEDMGRQARRITVQGFLVGDDVIARRDAFIRAAEASGDGELVHPTLGRVTVALMDFGFTERWDRGRVIDITLVCIEQGKRLYPQAKTDDAKAAQAAAAVSKRQQALQFIADATAKLRTVTDAAASAAREASAWASLGISVVRDATSLWNTAANLAGEFGRIGKAVKGLGLSPTRTPTATAISALVGQGAAARAAVGTSATTLATASAGLSATTIPAFTDAAAGLAAAVRAASPTPGQAVRALLQLAARPTAGSGPLSDAAGALLRRAALAELVLAVTTYTAASADDAHDLRQTVTRALDAEITAAGDTGADGVYAALTTCRTHVVAALNAAGAAMPAMKPMTLPAGQPSLVLAHRLYQDAGRADELVAATAVRHPAFMPTGFRVLAS